MQALIASGDLPTQKGEGGRWLIYKDDLGWHANGGQGVKKRIERQYNHNYTDIQVVDIEIGAVSASLDDDCLFLLFFISSIFRTNCYIITLNTV